MAAKKTATKDPVMVAAGKKAAATRKANAHKRSLAAKKAWRTRLANAR